MVLCKMIKNVNNITENYPEIYVYVYVYVYICILNTGIISNTQKLSAITNSYNKDIVSSNNKLLKNVSAI